MKPFCGNSITLSPYGQSFAVIESPNYPNVPKSHIECDWIIHAPPGEILRVDFEDRFDLTPAKGQVFCLRRFL